MEGSKAEFYLWREFKFEARDLRQLYDDADELFKKLEEMDLFNPTDITSEDLMRRIIDDYFIDKHVIRKRRTY